MTYSWIQKNETIRIYDSYIAKGSLYVGTGLYSANRTVADVCLINPNLEVDKNCTDFTMAMPYWPAYATISPCQRNAYLTWLALDCPTGADIGFVFLRFYGLEHRSLYANIVLEDEEQQTLIYEVVELLHKFGDNLSFRKYATSLLGLQASLFKKFELVLALLDDIPELVSSEYEYPLYYKIMLGHYLASQKPLPSNWTFIAFRTHPHLAPKRKLIIRPDFAETFENELVSQSPHGFVLSNLKQAPKIKLFYAPASASLPEIGITQELINPAVNMEFTTFLGNLLTQVNTSLTEKNQGSEKLRKVLKHGGSYKWEGPHVDIALNKAPYTCSLLEFITEIFGCKSPNSLTDLEWANFRDALLIKGFRLWTPIAQKQIKIQKHMVILVTNKVAAHLTDLIPELTIRGMLEKLVDSQIKAVTPTNPVSSETGIIREFLEKTLNWKNATTAYKQLSALPTQTKLKNLGIVIRDTPPNLADAAEIKKWVQLGHKLKIEDTDLYDLMHDTARKYVGGNNVGTVPEDANTLISTTLTVAKLLDVLLNSDEAPEPMLNSAPAINIIAPPPIKAQKKDLDIQAIPQDLASIMELLISMPIPSLDAFTKLLTGTRLMPDGAIEQINDITQDIFGDQLIEDIESFELNPVVRQQLLKKFSH